MEKEMATHSSILAWKIPWTEEPGRLYGPWGCKELDTTAHTHTRAHTHTHEYLVAQLTIRKPLVSKRY